MTHARINLRSTGLLALALMATLWFVQSTMAPAASAHGKELTVTVTSLLPDGGRPLTRLYRATVAYAGDLEPVADATVILTATLTHASGSAFEIEPLRLTAVGGSAGLYVGEVTYARFGDWEVGVHVEAAFGQGEGEASFTEALAPGALSAAGAAALEAEGARVYRLQLLFGFDWWPDVVNVLLRIVHSGAGLAYFVVTGAALALAWFGVPVGRSDLPQKLARVFPIAAFGSLALLLAAGLYSAAFDAPITAPGIYDIEGMRRIPYGDWYLAAFIVKPILFIVLAVLAVRIYGDLKAWPPMTIRGGASAVLAHGRAADAAVAAVIPRLRQLTVANAIVGLVLVADVAVVIYLHYVSHLGVFLPPE